MRKIDLTGLTFGRLAVLEEVENTSKKVKWLCLCSCGGTTIAMSSNLRRGTTESCGCVQKERTSSARKKHGMSFTPEHRAWVSMKHRCLNPTSNRYHTYGARGISICQEWIESFEAFYADMGPRPSAKHSLDRIHVDGNYEPGNCRWATLEQQARNTTRNAITEQTAKEIKADLSHMRPCKIAEKFKVSRGIISSIKTEKTWVGV